VSGVNGNLVKYREDAGRFDDVVKSQQQTRYKSFVVGEVSLFV
jgi:hypothetical protein